MELKMRLVRDGETIFEIPLSPVDWPKERLEDELRTLEEDSRRLSKIFDALSNETRLMMMRRLIEEEGRAMNFSDFMRDLELNPKTVWDNARKLSEVGLLKKAGRGRYRCSDLGQSAFMMMNLALIRLIEAMEEYENF